MGIEFRYDGKSIDLDDMPLDVYVRIETETKVPWFQVSAAPAMNAAAGQMLAVECAKHLQVDLPSPLTPRLLVKLFEPTGDRDNRPAEFEDGMPDPKVEGSEPATT